ncbi:MAG: type II toxin-antitoxin system death-on-curing family toxin [Alphaproteobacteria bacterium]
MSQWVWLGLEDAFAIHGAVLAEHGGPPGIRDIGLLQSALARPRQAEAYADPGVCGLGAAYTAGIVGNHPFVDGNKRTGFVMGVLFLEMNGLAFTAPETDATAAVLALAAGELTEDMFAAWLRENSAGD